MNYSYKTKPYEDKNWTILRITRGLKLLSILLELKLYYILKRNRTDYFWTGAMEEKKDFE